MDELNHRGKKFVDEWCNEKHTTTRRIPNQYYLLEEKQLLQQLPKTRYRVKQLQKRIVSPDSYVSIISNKYSVPVKHVGKAVMFRVIYGFRIEIYDAKENFIMCLESSDGRHQTLTDPGHYEPIAPKVSTSIPQIRRDFTARFRNGAKYLEAASRKFDQPTHYARKIMELQELYDDQLLDYFIGTAVEEDKMDIRSFRSLLRDYNSGKRTVTQEQPDNSMQATSFGGDDISLTRDCSYYEFTVEEGQHATNIS